jgi:Zn-dependent metalloprotease
MTKPGDAHEGDAQKDDARASSTQDGQIRLSQFVQKLAQKEAAGAAPAGVGPAAEAGQAPRQGVIPPYLLEELSRRNPADQSYRRTIEQTRALARPTWRPDWSPYNFSEEGGAREVYDAQGKEADGVKARFEGEAPTGDPEVNNVYDYTGEVRNFYKSVFHRNSIDAKGMKLLSTVNYGNNYENAFWNGSRMTYGRPGPDSPFRTFVLLDVTAHEMTHGVTDADSPLRYWGQSGALSESLSDVFGELAQQKALHQTADQASWLIGEGIWKDGIKGRALRDMRNPGTAYDDPKTGKDPQPADMDHYVMTYSDNGGVHINSGIPNRAFALFATKVGGNAWERPGEIWYETRKSFKSSLVFFDQFAYKTIETAKRLGYTDLVPRLEEAWKEVGVKPSSKENSEKSAASGGR